MEKPPFLEGRNKVESEGKKRRIVLDLGAAPNSTALRKSTRKRSQDELYVSADIQRSNRSEWPDSLDADKNYQHLTCNGENLPFKNDSLDEVIVSNVFGSYRRSKERMSAVLDDFNGRVGLIADVSGEIHRTLKPGGKFIITSTYTPWGDINFTFGTVEKLVAFLESQGFKVEAVYKLVNDRGEIDPEAKSKITEYAELNPRHETYLESFQIRLTK